MSYLLAVCAVLSVIYGIFAGNMPDISNQILDSAKSAVEICLNITGAICLWNGLMEVAVNCGITAKLSKVLSPILSRIFTGIDKKGKAMQAISLNIVSNFLGLGNASTPLGIKAMKLLESEEAVKDAASRNMITLTVMNTASIQLVPTTVAAIRLSEGSNSPFEIIPAVLLVSLVSVSAAVLSVRLFDYIKRRKNV